MAKTIPSVIGVDIGRHTIKAVCLSRRGSSVAVTDFATRTLNEPFKTSEELAQQLRLLLRDTSGGPRPCGITVSGLDSMARMIEQPDTPPHLLRAGLHLNGQAILNQDCQHFVLDCDYAKPRGAVVEGQPLPSGGTLPKISYFVAGLPRTLVEKVSTAFQILKYPAKTLQVVPVSLFNAFDFAYVDVSMNEAAVLLDIGHEESTLVIACRGEIVMVRTIDFGGKTMMEALAGGGAVDQYTALALLQQGDLGVIDELNDCLAGLAREVITSIGFFEGHREETVRRVFISGGPSSTDVLLQLLSDNLDLICEVWDPFARCQIAVPKAKKTALKQDLVSLNCAFGAALAASGVLDK